jgi:hypothetical protein
MSGRNNHSIKLIFPPVVRWTYTIDVARLAKGHGPFLIPFLHLFHGGIETREMIVIFEYLPQILPHNAKLSL